MSCLDDISSFWSFLNSDTTSCFLDTMGVKNPSSFSSPNSDIVGNNNNYNNNNNNNSSSNSPTVTTIMEKEEDPNIKPAVIELGDQKRSGRSSRRKKDKVVSSNEKGEVGGVESEHEIHIWTERERRKKMRNMFSTLHSLLPQLPPKADKSTIVDEAVKYIKTLEETLQTLQKEKLEKFHGGVTSSNTKEESITRESYLADIKQQQQLGPETTYNSSMSFSSGSAAPNYFQTWFSQNVVINVCGDEAQVSICSPKRHGLSATIFYILQKHKLDVLSAHISSDKYRSMYMIHVRGRGVTDDEFADALPMEDIFKIAAGEVNLWLMSC